MDADDGWQVLWKYDISRQVGQRWSDIQRLSHSNADTSADTQTHTRSDINTETQQEIQMTYNGSVI